MEKYIKKLLLPAFIGGIIFLLLNGGVAAVKDAIVFPLSQLTKLNILAQPSVTTPSNQTPSSDEEARVISSVNAASPAVVSIVASKTVSVNQNNPFQGFCADPFFKQFFGDQCTSTQTQPPKSTTQEVAAGTGFVISPDGLILTNKHVVDISGATFKVFTLDNKEYSATVLAKDPLQDIAIIKINASGLATLQLADSDNVQIGQTVIAIGNALGQFSNTVSKGIVSGLSRSIVASEGSGGTSEVLNKVIQTDAAINPGNSGGPLLNLNGQVVGINTAVAQGAQNIGFAIPINQAKKDIVQVESNGKIIYPFLGVRYVGVTADIQQANSLPVDHGAWVTSSGGQPAVGAGSPAQKAGLKAGDIIIQLNGNDITPTHDLSSQIQKFNPDDKITLTVLRNGSQMTLTVTLGKINS